MLTLTEEDIQAIAAASRQQATAFHIDDKAHYDCHARLDRLLGIFEYCESRAWRFIFALVAIFGFVMAVIWSALSGGKGA